MRPNLTWLLVGAVGLLAALAVADALRPNHGEAVPEATTTRARSPTPRETSRIQAVNGFVLYSDGNCRLHYLALPAMDDFVVRREGTNDPVRRCRLAGGGAHVLAEDELISPDGTRVARCRRGHVEVLDASTMTVRSRVPGCAPAWLRDGRLTYLRDGQILLGGRTVLLSRSGLRRIARRHPNVAGLGAGVPYRVRVVALAWLDRRRMAASLQVRIAGVEPQSFVVLLDGTRLVTISALFAGTARELLVSPAGSFVVDPGGTIVTREGRIYPLPDGVPHPQAVGFSPDERWLAVATGTSIYLVGTPTPEQLGRIIRLPVPARDLAWEPGGPVIDASRAD